MMPPAGGLDETDEQRRARIIGSLRPDLMPPAGPSGQPLATSGTGMPPIQPVPSQQPPSAAPSVSTMPAASMGAPAQSPEPQLKGWKKWVDSIGSIFPIGRAIEEGIPGTPQNWQVRQAEQAEREGKAAETAQKNATATAEQSRGRLSDEQAKQLGNMVPVTLPNGQTIYLNEKDATAIMGKQVQGSTAETVQGMRGDTAESIQDQKGDTAVTVQGMKGDTAENIAGAKAPTTKTVMVNGKPEVMGWNSETQKFDIPFGEAPPTYASAVMPTKTIDVIADNGMPTMMGYNEQTKKYDIPMGVSASGASGSRIIQADAVTRAADGLISDIKANRGKLGNIKAIIQSAILDTPWADPETAQLRAEIVSFAALNPAMHGFRGTNALREFEKLMGGIPNNPDAMIAALEGIKKTAGAIKGPASSGLPTGANKGNTASAVGHSFTFGGKTYANVPDDVYNKYKGQPGFVDAAK